MEVEKGVMTAMSKINIHEVAEKSKHSSLADIYKDGNYDFSRVMFYHALKKLEVKTGVKVTRNTGKRKLDKETYFNILRLRAEGVQIKEINKILGIAVAQSTMTHIFKGRLYKEWYTEFYGKKCATSNVCYRPGCGNDKGSNRMFCKPCAEANAKVPETELYSIGGSIGRRSSI